MHLRTKENQSIKANRPELCRVVNLTALRCGQRERVREKGEGKRDTDRFSKVLYKGSSYMLRKRKIRIKERAEYT